MTSLNYPPFASLTGATISPQRLKLQSNLNGSNMEIYSRYVVWAIEG